MCRKKHMLVVVGLKMGVSVKSLYFFDFFSDQRVQVDLLLSFV